MVTHVLQSMISNKQIYLKIYQYLFSSNMNDMVPYIITAGAIGLGLLIKYLKSKTTINEAENEFEFKDKSDYRMMLVVRNDLKMGKGKIAAQCCHAAVSSYEAMTKKRQYLLKPWLKNGTAKIAVKVESEEELLEVERKAKELKILTKIVRDAGHTQVAPMSRTVLSLGPAPKKILDQVTGHLKLL
ncbi:peptidyl-tRNA hydrolase 2, mitochondrial-like isoform X2 [Harmonia axyridis]|uniref:peptidyl-tRNA hydrolase 2, mitochondrial-like isoform X2 n=1 Tax=Harmonia axyridis TaxID=115357 RepID=UPI001E27516B|nr:peptidyl-tRNA hydrolase 2, mitochondrial-like isoform X2 [Harmonia axyridis]